MMSDITAPKERYFALGGGGLGDFLIAYFGLIPGHNRAFLRAEAARLRGGYTRAVITSHNPACIDILRFDSRFDSLEFLPYLPAEVPALRRALSDWGRDLDEEKFPEDTEPFIYPDTVSDWALFEQFGLENWLDGEYAVFHPFANGKRVISEPITPIPGLITLIIGADNIRTWGGGIQHMPEPCEIADGVIDLRNICNARQACLLVERAKEFHGGLSAFIWAACAFGTDSRCYIPHGFENEYTDLLKRFKNIERVDV